MPVSDTCGISSRVIRNFELTDDLVTCIKARKPKGNGRARLF